MRGAILVPAKIDAVEHAVSRALAHLALERFPDRQRACRKSGPLRSTSTQSLLAELSGRKPFANPKPQPSVQGMTCKRCAAPSGVAFRVLRHREQRLVRARCIRIRT